MEPNVDIAKVMLFKDLIYPAADLFITALAGILIVFYIHKRQTSHVVNEKIIELYFDLIDSEQTIRNFIKNDCRVFIFKEFVRQLDVNDFNVGDHEILHQMSDLFDEFMITVNKSLDCKGNCADFDFSALAIYELENLDRLLDRIKFCVGSRNYNKMLSGYDTDIYSIICDTPLLSDKHLEINNILTKNNSVDIINDRISHLKDCIITKGEFGNIFIEHLSIIDSVVPEIDSKFNNISLEKYYAKLRSNLP